MPRRNIDQMVFAMGLLKAGETARKVAEVLGVHILATLILAIKVDIMGLRDRPRRGRSKLPIWDQKEQLMCLVHDPPFKCTRALKDPKEEDLGNLNVRVIQKIPKKRGLSCRRAVAVKPDAGNEGQEAGLV